MPRKTGECAIARKRKPEPPSEPVEARRVAVGTSVVEIALALLVGWLVYRSGIARFASSSADLGAGDVLILASALGCLAVLVYVLGAAQWRLRGRDRVRLLLTGYLTLMMSFFGLCWFDVSMRSAELPAKGEGVSALGRVIERTAAASLALGSLLVGLIFVAMFLWLGRRALNPAARDAIVEGV